MDRTSLVSAGLVVSLIGGVVWLLWARVPLPSCPADGLVVEAPEGWHLERDRANGCEWTLFNEASERAPRQLYDGLPIDPPPSIWLDPVRLVPAVLVIGSLAGLVAMSRRRRASEFSSAPRHD